MVLPEHPALNELLVHAGKLQILCSQQPWWPSMHCCEHCCRVLRVYMPADLGANMQACTHAFVPISLLAYRPQRKALNPKPSVPQSGGSSRPVRARSSARKVCSSDRLGLRGLCAAPGPSNIIPSLGSYWFYGWAVYKQSPKKNYRESREGNCLAASCRGRNIIIQRPAFSQVAAE